MIAFISAMLLSLPLQSAPDCAYDRAAMLALDQAAFDQDMDGGWRALARRGCNREAADLIRDWREAHRAEDTILYWHEGQVRANIGETEAAVALFRRSYKSADQDYGGAWAPYVDGSIAFLQGDRASLEAARARLAALPVPADFEALQARTATVRIRWPLNLEVFDRLLRCWGQSYREAYSRPESAGKVNPAAINEPLRKVPG